MTSAVNNGVAPLLKSRTFNFTGGEQTFKVPNGVTSLTIVARGAQGGGEKGGLGGRVYAVIPVLPKERLYVFVGGQGIDQSGGFNGGAGGGKSRFTGIYGDGGGGATDIRTDRAHLNSRIVVAGGGGGDGEPKCEYCTAASGGKGGASTGGKGQKGIGRDGGFGGNGGSQYLGGRGGHGGRGSLRGRRGKEGGFLIGGAGGAGGYDGGAAGGGGGGGYYGGGGGGAGGFDLRYEGGSGGGGGGGSSYVEFKAIKYQSWQGWKNAVGNGLAVISWK